MSGLHRNLLRTGYRRVFQIAGVIVANPWFPYITTRKIYQGKAKGFCVPALNCYACPFALFSCPIGSLQHSFGLFHRGRELLEKALPSLFYAGGILLLTGMISGRLTCGWICPFGFLQDLLYKIPGRKIRIPEKMKPLRYVTLLVLVFFLPLLTGVHWFSRLCPAGSLEGAIPLLILKPASGLPPLGAFFWFKISILAAILAWMVFTSRPFCRTLCPLGALYGLFNRISLYRLDVLNETCTGCGKCVSVCPVEIDITQDPNSTECIRCLECKRACPTEAIRFGFGSSYPRNKEQSKESVGDYPEN